MKSKNSLWNEQCAEKTQLLTFSNRKKRVRIPKAKFAGKAFAKIPARGSMRLRASDPDGKKKDLPPPPPGTKEMIASFLNAIKNGQLGLGPINPPSPDDKPTLVVGIIGLQAPLPVPNENQTPSFNITVWKIQWAKLQQAFYNILANGEAIEKKRLIFQCFVSLGLRTDCRQPEISPFASLYAATPERFRATMRRDFFGLLRLCGFYSEAAEMKANQNFHMETPKSRRPPSDN